MSRVLIHDVVFIKNAKMPKRRQKEVFMRKLIRKMSLALALVLCLSMTACGAKTESNTSETMTGEAVETTVSEVAESESTAATEVTEETESTGDTEEALTAVNPDLDTESWQNLGPGEGTVLEDIKERGVLRACIDATFPPFGFVDPSTNEIHGIGVKILTAVAEELGVELQVDGMPFASCLPALSRGEYDICIACVSITEDRLQVMDFTSPYITTNSTYLIRSEDADKIKTVDDLKGLTIAANLGSNEASNAKSIEGVTVVELDTTADTVMELMTDKVDAVGLVDVVAQRYAEKFDGLAVTENINFTALDKAFPVNKGNEDFLEVLNKVIDEALENGQMDTWFSECIQESLELD